MKTLQRLKIGLLALLTVVGAFLNACQMPLTQDLERQPTEATGFTYSTTRGAIWRVDVNGHQTLLSPEDGIPKWHLEWSPTRRYLAYVTHEFSQLREGTPDGLPTESGKTTLAVIETGNNTPEKLTKPAHAIQYIWADDHTISFQITEQITHDQKQQWQYFRTNLESGITISMTKSVELSPTPSLSSPDGQWSLLFERNAKQTCLYLCDAVGNKVIALHETEMHQDIVSQWSPDSRYVLYLGYTFPGSDDIHIYDTVTKEETQVTNFTEQEENFTLWNPQWSPTGEWVFFNLDTATYTQQPCLINIPTYTLQCYDIMPKSDQFVWSTDGRYLAFLAPRGDNPIDLYVIDAKERTVSNLTQNGWAIVEDWIAP